MSAIKVEHVSKKFRLQSDKAHSVKELVTRRDRSAGADEFWALRDVSFEIEQGSMFALVGHNGCGKSTLLRCIAGIYQPTEGHVSVEGRISTLLELGAGFHPDLTGRENVYMNATILGMSRRDIDKAFDSIVEFAGVTEFIDSPVKIYSSGMFVRLGFSVAVHVHPEILIVDEVIAVGDEEFQRKCFDHLYGLRKEGVTIVVVTHGMGTVETMCDGAAWLDRGELQIVGEPAEVTAAYLDQVNAVEDVERRRRAQIVSPDADDGDGPADVEDDVVEVLPIEIAELVVCNERGEEVTSVTHGEAVEIVIRYDATEAIDDLAFGYAIYGENGVHICGSHTAIAKATVPPVAPGRGQVSFRIPDLPLTPGNYELSAAIADSHLQHMYDRRERVTRMVVRRGSIQAGAGFIEMPGSWVFGNAPEGT